MRQEHSQSTLERLLNRSQASICGVSACLTAYTLCFTFLFNCLYIALYILFNCLYIVLRLYFLLLTNAQTLLMLMLILILMLLLLMRTIIFNHNTIIPNLHQPFINNSRDLNICTQNSPSPKLNLVGLTLRYKRMKLCFW